MSIIAQRMGENPDTVSWEQPLSPKIEDYIHNVARHLQKPIEIQHVRVHPSTVAEEIFQKLRAFEKQAVSVREEFAAHEFTDHRKEPLPLDEGRCQLADLIATMVIPLADVTHAYDLYVTLRIGADLDPPVAEGLGICASFISEMHDNGRRGIFRRRLVFKRETEAPAGEKKIQIGMTLICWPGKIDFGRAYGDGTRGKFIHLSEGDNALYRMTLNTLRAFEDRRQALADSQNLAERETLRHASDSLRVTLIALAASRAKASADAAAASIADLPAVPFADDARGALQAVKVVSPSQSVAAQTLLTEIDRRAPPAAAPVQAPVAPAAGAELIWGKGPTVPHMVHDAVDENAPQNV